MAKNLAPEPGQSHPFDTPYGIIKAMQAELTSLKAALDEERTQRAQEVAQLQKECSDLRDALATEKSQRTDSCDKLNRDLNSETAARTREVERIDHDCTATKTLLNKTIDQQNTNIQHLSQLDKGLATETHERQAGDQDLSTRLNKETDERKDETQTIFKELDVHKQTIETNDNYARQRLNFVNKNAQMAGKFMLAGCGAEAGAQRG